MGITTKKINQKTTNTAHTARAQKPVIVKKKKLVPKHRKKSKVGKLKKRRHVKFNVAALLPGAERPKPKKSKSTSDQQQAITQDISQSQSQSQEKPRSVDDHHDTSPTNLFEDAATTTTTTTSMTGLVYAVLFIFRLVLFSYVVCV